MKNKYEAQVAIVTTNKYIDVHTDECEGRSLYRFLMGKVQLGQKYAQSFSCRLHKAVPAAVGHGGTLTKNPIVVRDGWREGE